MRTPDSACGASASTIARVAAAVPAPAHQVTFDLRDGGPSSFSMEPPAFAVHRHAPGAGLASHHVYVDASDGAHALFEATGTVID